LIGCDQHIASEQFDDAHSQQRRPVALEQQRRSLVEMHHPTELVDDQRRRRHLLESELWLDRDN
jgi:hypothetical protein